MSDKEELNGYEAEQGREDGSGYTYTISSNPGLGSYYPGAEKTK